MHLLNNAKAVPCHAGKLCACTRLTHSARHVEEAFGLPTPWFKNEGAAVHDGAWMCTETEP